MEFKYRTMARNTKDNGKIICNMDKEYINGHKDTYMKGNGKMA